MTTHFTFGSDHDRAHPWLGSLRLSEGYLTVEAGNIHREHAIGQAVLGPVYAFDYTNSEQWRKDNETKGYYPAGELARITLITQAQRAEALDIIEQTFIAAEGDSNDDEIQILQQARDLLASLIGKDIE